MSFIAALHNGVSAAAITAHLGVVEAAESHSLAYRSTQQTLAVGDNAVDFDLEAVDAVAAHDTVTNPSRFVVTAPFNGRYARFSAGLNADEATASRMTLHGYKNGAVYPGSPSCLSASTGTTSATLMGAAIAVATDDYFSLNCNVPTTGTVEVAGTWGQLEYLASDFNGALAYKSGTQVIALNTYTAVAFATEAYDLDGWFDTAANTIFTVPAGVSLIRLTANVVSAANTTQFIIKPQKNGADFAGAFLRDVETSNSLARDLNGSTGPIAVSAGDTFTTMAFGAAQTLPVSNKTWMQIEELPSDLMYARLARSSNLAAAGTPTAFAWQTESADVGGWANLATHSTRLTVPAGVTHVRLHGNAQGSGVSGQWLLSFRKNGAAFVGAGTYDSDTAGGDFAHACSAIIEVVEGDYFEMTLSTGSSHSVQANEFSWFSIEEVRLL